MKTVKFYVRHTIEISQEQYEFLKDEYSLYKTVAPNVKSIMDLDRFILNVLLSIGLGAVDHKIEDLKKAAKEGIVNDKPSDTDRDPVEETGDTDGREREGN